jgi:hypothetical protein
MEVDFLCAEARLVIEFDGAQHLADAEAYRRDRRKDALLQQHGYFVLRFLAEDVGKQLDACAGCSSDSTCAPTRPAEVSASALVTKGADNKRRGGLQSGFNLLSVLYDSAGAVGW